MTDPARKNTLEKCFFNGERPLYAIADTRLKNVHFYPGESALKHVREVSAHECEFMSKYPFWHAQDVSIEDCLFTADARAAIWYSSDVVMRNALVEAPKMFRQTRILTIEDTRFPNAGETLWTCSDVTVRDVEFEAADYIFMNGRNIDIDRMKLQGNYSFQDAKDVVVRNSHLDSKDAFWGTENVTVYDSILDGEYLGWHSKNLRLVNCTIRGEQPLCYATDLVMENCRMEDTDLCFEYSTLHADIDGHIKSVKNPKGGAIHARSIGEIIIDHNCIEPGACVIYIDEEAVS